MVRRPVCDVCGVKMVRCQSRAKQPGDDRPPSKRPYVGFGFVCLSCRKVQFDPFVPEPTPP